MWQEKDAITVCINQGFKRRHVNAWLHVQTKWKCFLVFKFKTEHFISCVYRWEGLIVIRSARKAVCGSKYLKSNLKGLCHPFAVCLLYLQNLPDLFPHFASIVLSLRHVVLRTFEGFFTSKQVSIVCVLIIFYLAAGVSLTAVAETLDQENRKSFSAPLPSTSSLTRGIINSFRTSVIRSMTCSTILVYHSGVSC